MLRESDDIDKDKKEADIYYKLTADNKHEDTMYCYAHILNEDDGIDKNENESCTPLQDDIRN